MNYQSENIDLYLNKDYGDEDNEDEEEDIEQD